MTESNRPRLNLAALALAALLPVLALNACDDHDSTGEAKTSGTRSASKYTFSGTFEADWALERADSHTGDLSVPVWSVEPSKDAAPSDEPARPDLHLRGWSLYPCGDSTYRDDIPAMTDFVETLISSKSRDAQAHSAILVFEDAWSAKQARRILMQRVAPASCESLDLPHRPDVPVTIDDQTSHTFLGGPVWDLGTYQKTDGTVAASYRTVAASYRTVFFLQGNALQIVDGWQIHPAAKTPNERPLTVLIAELLGQGANAFDEMGIPTSSIVVQAPSGPVTDTR